jgi:type IV pilus assembly protein PilB
VNVILMSAIQKGASDIHIEPYEKELRVRYRIDGLLYNIMQPPMKFRDAITSRIKIMSKLDIAEKRLPQDGRIKIRFQDQGQNRDIDFRVSCLPTLFGEKIVMRLLDKEKLMLDMTKLGFEQESLNKFETPSKSRGAWCS